MLVEREHNLRSLKSALAECADDGSRSVMVTGPAGIGKTALLRTFLADVEDQGVPALFAVAHDSETEFPFGVLGQLMTTPELPEIERRRVARLIERSSSRAISESAAARISYELGVVLLALLERVSCPIVIVIDDAHLGDSPSLQCVYAVLRRLRRGRALLVLAECLRTEPLGTSLPDTFSPQSIRLEPLTPQGVATLLASRMGAANADRARHSCYAIGRGNPMLTQALLNDTCEASGDGPAVTRLGSAFRRALLHCLNRSGPVVCDVALAFTVLAGQTAVTRSRTLVCELVGLPEETVERALSVLAPFGFTAERGFRQPQARGILLEECTSDHLTELRARLARVFYDHGEATQAIADNLVLTGERFPADLSHVVQEAGRQMLDLGNVDEALRYLRFALQSDDRLDPAGRALTRLLLIRGSWQSDPALALRYLPEATAEMSSDMLRSGDAALPVATQLWFGAPEEATRILADASIAPDSCAGLAAMRLWLASAYPAVGGPPATDVPPVARAAAASTQLHAAALMHEILSSGADAECHETAQGILANLPLNHQNCPLLASALACLISAGDLRTAAAAADDLVRQATLAKIPLWQALFSALRADVAVRENMPALAAEHARDALASLPMRSWGVAVGLPLGAMLDAQVGSGEFGRARELLSAPVPGSMFRTPFGLYYLRARGRYRLETGNDRAALEDLSYVGDTMARWGFRDSTLIPWRLDAAHARLRLGDRAGARALLLEELATDHLRDDEQLAELMADMDTGPSTLDDAIAAHDVLSEAQVRVAALAAEGLSNRQIAAQLYITVSTVEQHLTKIYRKLDITKRAQLTKHFGSTTAARGRDSEATRPPGFHHTISLHRHAGSSRRSTA